MFVESGTESSGWGCSERRCGGSGVEWSVGVDGVMIAWWRCVCVCGGWGGGGGGAYEAPVAARNLVQQPGVGARRHCRVPNTCQIDLRVDPLHAIETYRR